jgi:endoglucanase
MHLLGVPCDISESVMAARYWRIVRTGISMVLAVLLAACGGGSCDISNTDQSAQGAVTVSGRRFLRDGRPWVPKGLVSVAFNAALSVRSAVETSSANGIRS